MKNDQGKPPYDLLPWAEMDDVAQVFAYGSRKYAKDNWKQLDAERLIAAAIRHLSLYQQGQTMDDESGMNHLAHATTSALMALWHSNNGYDWDSGLEPDLYDSQKDWPREHTEPADECWCKKEDSRPLSDNYDTSDEVRNAGLDTWLERLRERQYEDD